MSDKEYESEGDIFEGEYEDQYIEEEYPVEQDDGHQSKVYTGEYPAKKPGQDLEGAEPIQKQIPATERISMPVLTKYERVRVLGLRSTQISMNAPVYVTLENETDPYEIAKKELAEKMLPFKIRRYLPGGGYEDWELKELTQI